MKPRTLKQTLTLILCALMVIALSGCTSLDGQYEKANKLMVQGKYEEAALKFEALGSYSDAPRMTQYCRAIAAGESGSYENAVKVFESMADFKDCPSLAAYYSARQLEDKGGKETDPLLWYDAGDWQHCLSAAELYDTLPMFRDSDSRAAACRGRVYDAAKVFAGEGNYAAAITLMDRLGEYEEAPELTTYYTGCDLEAGQKYTEAYDQFASLGEYGDAPARAKAVLDAIYTGAEAKSAAGDYQGAHSDFLWLALHTEYTHENGTPALRANENAYLFGVWLMERASDPENENYLDDFNAARSWFSHFDYTPEGGASSQVRLQESWVLQGERLMGESVPDFEAAKTAFANAGDYPGASTRFSELCYEMGVEHMTREVPSYANARALFSYANADSLYAPEGKPTATERILECWYLEGEALMAAETPNYPAAWGTFANAGDYPGASTRFYELCYLRGEEKLAAEKPDYAAARTEFAHAEEYAPEGKPAATERVKECWYLEGCALEEQGSITDACAAFLNAEGYGDSKERLEKLMLESSDAYSAGEYHTLLVEKDGSVVACGRNTYGQCDVTQWKNVIQVSAGETHSVGLLSGGWVVAAGTESLCRGMEDWADIVSVDAGVKHTLGLKADGTVVAAGSDQYGQCAVEGWSDIVAISAGSGHSVGLMSDGSVVAAGNPAYGACDVQGMREIIAVSAGMNHTVALRSDGVVMAVGSNALGQCSVEDWTDIVAISAGSTHTVGLRADGTVVACGNNMAGQCEVDGWTDIVSISAGGSHTIGRKKDGSYVTAGGNKAGQCDLPGRAVQTGGGKNSDPAKKPGAVGSTAFVPQDVMIPASASNLCANKTRRTETALALVESLRTKLELSEKDVDRERIYIGFDDRILYVAFACSGDRVALIRVDTTNASCSYTLQDAVPGKCVKVIQEKCGNHYFKVDAGK